MTFNDFCRTANVTQSERTELVWYLAFLRLRLTLEGLL